MSPFRRAREKSLTLALKKGNYSLRNELDKEYYQNYKVKKLSAKVAVDQKRERAKEAKLRPLSMRTLALKNNPIYGSNPNSVAFLQSLSAHGPSRMHPSSFSGYGNAYAFNPVQQMSRLRDQSLRDPNRNTNMLRDQRIKLLEDNDFLKTNSRLGQFIFSKNRDSLSFNPMNQMPREHDFRRQRFNPYPTMRENHFARPTKTNFFKFEKPEEKKVEQEDIEYYYEYEDEPETQIKVVNKLPNFEDVTTTTTTTTTEKSKTTTTTTAPEIFQQSDESNQRLAELIREDLREDEKIDKRKPKKSSVRRLSMSNNETKLIDWDEIEKEDKEYEKTVNLQNALKSFLNSKLESF